MSIQPLVKQVVDRICRRLEDPETFPDWFVDAAPTIAEAIDAITDGLRCVAVALYTLSAKRAGRILERARTESEQSD